MFENDLIFDYDKEPQRDILCIDCKSFYASVECVARGLNPLKTILVVLSHAAGSKTSSGLILASSPLAKKYLHITNVNRERDLPHPYPQNLLVVPPRMKLYMQEHAKINMIYKSFVGNDNHHVFSVDESFLDVSDSLIYMKCDNARAAARKIQLAVKEELGLYTTVGIGDNPLLAKLALDNEAKHNHDLIAEWRYKDVPDKVWNIPQLTDFCGIGKHLALRLNKLGIYSINDLAHTNYYLLKSKLGVLGAQLYAHSWGIDRRFLNHPHRQARKSYGNSQVLPRDYYKMAEIKIVLREIAEQVASRLRTKHVQAQVVSVFIGYSRGYTDEKGKHGANKQIKITPTNQSEMLTKVVLRIFDELFAHQPIRNLGVSYGNVIPAVAQQLDLFSSPDKIERNTKLDETIDKLHAAYGFKSLMKASSLMEGGTALNRSGLVGGHAGGMEGLND